MGIALRKTKWLYIVGVTCLPLMMAGCLKPLTPSFHTESISLTVDQDANQDSATAVDMVVVYEEEILKTLVSLPADKYFAQAKQLKRDHPKMIETFHWEVVPGQAIQYNKLNYKKSGPPLAAIIFARYISPGEHRKIIGSQENVGIHLMKDGFETYALSDYNSELGHYKESE